MADKRVPRLPPPGHGFPPDVVEHIYQLRGFRIPDEHRKDFNWPPEGSPEELPVEAIAKTLGYELPLPDSWFGRVGNIDGDLHNADWPKGE